jgi:hypothetical protein
LPKKDLVLLNASLREKIFQAIIFDYPGMAHRGFGGHLVILW